MRDSTNQAVALQQHRDLLVLQQLQLNDIQQKVASANSLLTSRLTSVSTDGDDKRHAQLPRKHRTGHRKLSLRLPQFLTTRTWTLAAYHSQGSWTMEIQPEVWRPFESPALDFIRTGDITNIKKALDAGQLSVWDSTRHPSDSRFPTTLLGVSWRDWSQPRRHADLSVACDLPWPDRAVRLSVGQYGTLQKR